MEGKTSNERRTFPEDRGFEKGEELSANLGAFATLPRANPVPSGEALPRRA